MYCHLVVRQGLVWLYFIIIRAEKVNAYYLYIGQIKTSSSVDRSFVCCSESFDRHMEPHNSRFAKIRGARFAPPMGAMPHPTLHLIVEREPLDVDGATADEETERDP